MLVAHAVVQRDLLVDLPLVARRSPRRHPDRRPIHELQILAHGLWQAEQEVGERVVEIQCGPAVQCGQSAGEVEASARPVGGLRLKWLIV
jgi:hypothetical protein